MSTSLSEILLQMRLPDVIKGDGTPQRSYMYGDDLAVWMMTMLQRGRAGEVYNCGSAEAVSIGELAARVNAVLNPAGKIEILTPAVPGAAAAVYVPDISRAGTEFDVKITVALDEAIKLSSR